MKRTMSHIAMNSVFIGSLLIAGTAFAATPMPWHDGPHMRPAVIGTVAAISGNTVTVTAQGWAKPGTSAPTSTTYTVNAANATITKNGMTSSVSSIAVNDRVMVEGTVSGFTVTATAVMDGVQGMRGGMGMGGGHSEGHASTTPLITGNGEPIVGGTVSTVNGNSVTITNKNNTTYTVDVSGATVTKSGTARATLSSIAVGDSVVVQGTINGTAVTASSIMDSGFAATKGNTPPGQQRHGFFGAIGGFFTHLFGFF